MFENTHKYVVENVLKSYQEFIDHRKSNCWGEDQLLRKGINAAIALYHLREHIPKNIRPSFEYMKNLCEDYGLVRDIANVSKHNVLNKNDPRITSASQIFENMVNTRYEDEQGEYFSCQIEVFLRLDDGTEKKLVNVLYNVICMWRDLLDSLGIINIKEILPPKVDFPLSREETTRQANMSITRGEGYSWQFRFMEFNYEKNVSEPGEISNRKFQFYVKKLPEQIPIIIHIENPKFEINVDFLVPLTKEQANEYILLQNDENKHEFLKSIIDNNPNIRKKYRKLIIQAQIQELQKRKSVTNGNE